ncbi:MAG TPA: MarR family transcriptional regulator [Opitutaceae bacterium]|nr:MarR family transcriptional regulator [Opitutaceae bacterium]
MKMEPGYSLINQVLATSNVMVKESHRIFRPHGLTEAQFNVLNVLGPNPAGLSQRELSDVLIVDRSNVTNMLDRMEQNGWVKRGDHPADRRIYVVTLTPEGRKLWQKVLPEYLAAVEAVTSEFSEAEMRRTHEFLARLERAVRAWGASRGT